MNGIVKTLIDNANESKRWVMNKVVFVGVTRHQQSNPQSQIGLGNTCDLM